MNTTLETILRECVKSLGHDESMKILNSMKEEPTKEVKEKAKKRISRMSPTISNQLKTEFNNVEIKYEDKEFDKIKKEFVSYVDDLTDDDFSAKGLTEHMKDFVNIKVTHKDSPKEEKPKRGRKQTTTVTVTKKEEELQPPSNLAVINDMPLQELQQLEMLTAPVGPEKGIYWDAVNGRWVRGPQAVEDEDLVEMGFKLKTYMVGEKSGRVYEDQNGKDMFLGHVGIAEFKDMLMPPSK